mmetsp:Transcript_153392/g.268176  ORF Transcript_153392/g.268176 Transcript_153392/m.268176 type:complete len:338 (+) Transcript_153392:3952-4965(+)
MAAHVHPGVAKRKAGVKDRIQQLRHLPLRRLLRAHAHKRLQLGLLQGQEPPVGPGAPQIHLHALLGRDVDAGEHRLGLPPQAGPQEAHQKGRGPCALVLCHRGLNPHSLRMVQELEVMLEVAQTTLFGERSPRDTPPGLCGGVAQQLRTVPEQVGDLLGLVHHQAPPVHSVERGRRGLPPAPRAHVHPRLVVLPLQDVERRDHEVRRRTARPEVLPLLPVQRLHHPELRGEDGELLPPLPHQVGRHDERRGGVPRSVRACPAPRGWVVVDQGQHDPRLARPHLRGEDAPPGAGRAPLPVHRPVQRLALVRVEVLAPRDLLVLVLRLGAARGGLHLPQ